MPLFLVALATVLTLGLLGLTAIAAQRALEGIQCKRAQLLPSHVP